MSVSLAQGPNSGYLAAVGFTAHCQNSKAFDNEIWNCYTTSAILLSNISKARTLLY